ncbi:hypothetical protein [Paenibacillus apiarius]|uniref:hypothetical protein n=1 Tax=Paenibacillus apiarius TaxID=46240 RepID=UPI003B3A513A
MKKTKLFTAIFSAAFMLSFAAAASAAPLAPSVETSETSHTAGSGADTIGGISVFDSQLISPVHYVGKAAYTGKFTATPENGKFLDVWVKNNGSDTVYLTVKRNGNHFVSDIAISGGTEKTRTFESVVSGFSGDWEVYIYSATGAEMDLDIAASQF